MQYIEPTYKTILQKLWGLNFCITFISSISLILELAGSDLVQTLLKNPMAFGFFANEEKKSLVV